MLPALRRQDRPPKNRYTPLRVSCRRPWVVNEDVNWLTQRAYREINTLLLPPGEYATIKKVTEAGAV